MTWSEIKKKQIFLTMFLYISVSVDLVDSPDYILRVSGGREEFSLGRLKGVAVVIYISIPGGDGGVGSFLSGGSFEGDCDGNLEGVRTG